MLVFSTANQASDDAFAQWRTAICTHFVPLRPEPSVSCEEMFGELRGSPVGALTLTSIRITGQRIHRDRPEISRSNREVFFLTVQLTGETGFSCDDQHKLSRPGDMFLLDARRPFVLHCEAQSQSLALTIPRHVCGGRLAALDQLHGLVLNCGDAVGTLLRGYLRSLADAEGNLGVTESEDISDHVLALVGHALTRREAGSASLHKAARAALFTRAHRLIDRKLCDPDFDPACLARDTGVSLRQLQVLFSEQGTSPMRSIIERRSALAKRMLRDPVHAHKAITQIAFECGFRDQSHFGRVFAATTGQTPRAWRRNA